MIEDIPCKHCGSYYSHKPKCVYWAQTGLHNQILILEIKERVDRECYDLENKINSLQKRLDIATEYIGDCSVSHVESRYKHRARLLSEELKEGV